jgi:putative transposase
MHVVQRGVNRARCFDGAASNCMYLHILEEVAALYRCEVHAYVLMSNHVHLLMTPRTDTGVSLVMKNLGQRYAQGFNRTRSRTGPMWEGRFHSSVVDSDAYLLRCQRYIELNPVRAAMVEWPEQYPWSSYRANALGQGSTLITPHPVYAALAADAPDRQRVYRRLFASVPEEELRLIRESLDRGFPLGGAEFMESLRVQAGFPAGHCGKPRGRRKAKGPFLQAGNGV